MKNSDTLFQYFENAIIEGSLHTGQRLPSEKHLAETFAISRSSVREALQRLSAQGLITSKPGGGHFASKAFRQNPIELLLALSNHSPESRFDLLEFCHSS